jgi:hypothetical protein
MEFFNRKEDVVDIRLTRHGKKLYSQGKFSPFYYAFYDDDIIYDHSYASVGEAEHSASIRIKDAVRLKLPDSFIGIESNINRNGSQQTTKEKEYTLTSRISKSDLNSDFAPSWHINSYLGEIQTTEEYILTGSLKATIIPQLNMRDLTYTIKAVSEPDKNANLYGITYPDSTALTVDFSQGEFLVALMEKNTPLTNEQFDVEIYEVSSSVDEPEQLTSLNFRKRVSNVVNDLYVDVEETVEDLEDDMIVDNRFIIELDSEIDRNILTRAIGINGLLSDQSELRTFGDSGTLAGQPTSDDPSSGYISGLTLDDIAGLSPEEIETLKENQDNNPPHGEGDSPTECED